MNIERIKAVCFREMLGGKDFLDKFPEQLHALTCDTAYMADFRKFCEDIPHSVEFCTEPQNAVFVDFKKNILYKFAIDASLQERFSAYQSICTAVTEKGKALLSAVISIHFAIRYLTVDTIKAPKDAAPAGLRCDDGHYVRYKNEQLVDNWLYHHNVCHAYGALIINRFTAQEQRCDFYLPGLNLYIEVDSSTDGAYLAEKQEKFQLYAANGFRFLAINDKQMLSLDEHLRRAVLLQRF